MTPVARLRGLPPEQACEAVAVSSKLNDSQVFLLMGCLHFHKSPDLRVLHKSSVLSRPSIVLPLRESGAEPEAVLKSLIESGYMARTGLGKISPSPDGTIVEHRFSILANHLRLRGVLPGTGLRVSDVALLREYMRRVCSEVPI